MAEQNDLHLLTIEPLMHAGFQSPDLQQLLHPRNKTRELHMQSVTRLDTRR
jgi:hypothetical protein